MTTTVLCAYCRGAVAPDGWCWDCGRAQPDFRARLELTADGGAAGVSDRGLRRGVNADAMALAVAGAWTVGVVCDGVSMSPTPERAARVAAETGAAVTAAGLRDGALPETALTDAALRAGRAVAALAASVHHAPACTYVAAAVGPAGVFTCWIGDSRAYWLPDDGTALALTVDDAGDRDMLTAWLGADAGGLEPHLRSRRPSGPGRLLLCTDGLSRYLPGPDALRTALARRRVPAGDSIDLGTTESLSPKDTTLLADAAALVGFALDAGGHDNVTALLIPVNREAAGRADPEADPPGDDVRP